MAVRVQAGYVEQLITHTMTELAAQKERERSGGSSYQTDIVDWAQNHYYIAASLKPIKLYPHQICILRYMFTRRAEGHFPARTLIYSSVKKSGKTAIGSVCGRYMAETQAKYGDVFCCGNDMNQAQEREFLDIRRSIELTPGFDKSKERLPGKWAVHARTMNCLLSGSRIRAVSVDAKGEAGGAAALSIWTELWGFDTTDAVRFWEEMTPAPTIQDSMRLVETYAGFDDGSSKLLEDLYEAGMEGRQLTAGEICRFAARDVPGQTYEELLQGWWEADGNPDALIPVWHNEKAGIIMYWDSGLNARRMPWQHDYVGDFEDKESLCQACHQAPSLHVTANWASQYYAEQEASQPPAAFRRHHLNEWTGSESAFVPIEIWDVCGNVHQQNGWDPIPPLREGDRTPVLLGADGAVSADCFGIVAVKRCPYDPTAVDIKAYKKWDPAEEGGFIELSQPEEFLRKVAAVNNVVQIAYDPFQLADMMQRLTKDFVAWCDPFNQGADRLQADSRLYDLIINRRVHHSGQAEIREHVANANKKLQAAEDSKLRIVKKSNGRKIDLVVALSMAAHRCFTLVMENA
jgi:phage terminase large subunit-like protein